MTTGIELTGVSKRYKKYDDTSHGGGLLTRTRRSWLPALTDIDLVVGPGESVGVIGRNGAGKSTLLQLLCGVTAPTSGRVRVTGRVAPLISVGVGFHPEMTGRENVYVNGTILGMTRAQIDRRFDHIVAFAELEAFIDTPVKFYSSGMFVRLGFSVAVEAEPDVLLVDEVLAVGDLAFQVRCFERMNEIRAAGTTIVVVTHNMGSVRLFCDRGLVLESGRVAYDGTTFEAIGRYHALSAGEPGTPDVPGADVLESALLGPDGSATSHLRQGDVARLQLRVRARQAVPAPFLYVSVAGASGQVVYSEARINEPMAALAAGEEASYQVQLPLNLPTGSYSVDLALHGVSRPGQSELLAGAPRLAFYLSGRPHVHGAADLLARFERTS